MEFKITGTGRLMKFRDDDKEVVIPSTVKAISAYAFSERHCLERIVIPDSVKLIEAFAFANCTSLKEVIMGSGVQTIKEKAFVGCKSLESIALSESLVEMETYVFSECESLKEVKFGAKLKSIVAGTFLGCKNLALDVPKTITEIESGSISEIKSLNVPHLSNIRVEQDCIIDGDTIVGCLNSDKEVVCVPNSVTTIGYGAFEANNRIIKIVLPGGVSSIGDFAFACSEKLKELNIPKAVTQIGYSAFSGCSGVVPIYEGTSEEFAKIFVKTNNQILKKRIKFAQVESQESVKEKADILSSMLGAEYKKDIQKYSYITQRLRLMSMEGNLYDLMKVGVYLDPAKIVKVAKISDLKPAKLKNHIREIKVVEVKKYPASKNAYPKIYVDVLLEFEKRELTFNVCAMIECDPFLQCDLCIMNDIYVTKSYALDDIWEISPLCLGRIDSPIKIIISKEELANFGGVNSLVTQMQKGFAYNDNPRCTATAAEFKAYFENVKISNINLIENEKGYDIIADMSADFELIIEKENAYGESAGYEPRECSSKIEYK